MILFFYGEDTFSSSNNVQKIERSFVDSQRSDFNVSKFDGSRLQLDNFIIAVTSLPFLGDKRLIIIKNFQLENADKELKKKVASSVTNVPDSNTVIFLEEGVPDKRETLFKTLLSKATTKEFLPINSALLPRLISKRAEEAGVSISSSAIQKLALFVGADLWRLDNEIEKLILYSKSNGNEIGVSDIETLVSESLSLKVFDLTDAMAEKNVKKAGLILQRLLNAGEEGGMIFNMIIYQFRNMVIISDLNEKKGRAGAAKEAGLHPFVVQKILSRLDNFRPSALEEYYLKLRDFDWAIKSGGISIETALSTLMVDFCRK